jgi:hypothetical protein
VECGGAKEWEVGDWTWENGNRDSSVCKYEKIYFAVVVSFCSQASNFPLPTPHFLLLPSPLPIPHLFPISHLPLAISDSPFPFPTCNFLPFVTDCLCHFWAPTSNFPSPISHCPSLSTSKCAMRYGSSKRSFIAVVVYTVTSLMGVCCSLMAIQKNLLADRKVADFRKQGTVYLLVPGAIILSLCTMSPHHF